MTAALPLTPLADGAPHDRWSTLREQHSCALDVAAARTDHPCVHALIARYRRQLANFDCMIASAHGHQPTIDAVAEVALGRFGPNGLWSAIDDVMTQARNHGFDWREKAPATPVLNQPELAA